jgi:integrase
MAIAHLTEAKIQSHKCPEGKRQDELVDDSRTGLYLLTTQNGSKAYMLRFKSPLSKKTGHIKVGRIEDISLEDARGKVSELRKLITQGIDPRYHKEDKPDGSMLYPDFMKNHVLPYKKSMITSWRNMEGRFKKHLEKEFSGPLLSISRYQIQEYQTRLLDSGLSAASCNRIIQVLRHSLFLARDWGFIDKNPAERIKMFREDNEVERFLTDSQLESLVSVLKKDHNRPVSNILLFLLSTGARLNEALQARTENINCDNRTWKIPVSDAKSHKSRTLVLSTAAMSVVDQAYDEDSDWLFPNPQTEKPYTTITRVWYRIRKEAGIPEFRIHDLRHSYASYLAQAGESTITIAESLGHSDYRVSQRYVHLNQDTMRKAANHASDKIMAALDKVSGEN